MKKILLLVLIILCLILGYTFGVEKIVDRDEKLLNLEFRKKPIFRIALVADSHNENDLLKKALRQAQGAGINLVIGLGDYTNVGTLEELTTVKKVFEQSKLSYLTTAGDRDLWDSRNHGQEPLANFQKNFGQATMIFERENILFVILDNSDIYSGISQNDWEILNSKLKTQNSKLTFVFAHKTPFHPESKHVMGENNALVAKQAAEFLRLIETQKIAGFLAGDLHFFAKFKSPSGSVKMTTVGAVASERNFQGPRFAILTVWDDYSWEVEDVEIR